MSSDLLFALAAKLTLDKSEYDNGIDDAEKEGKSFGDRLGGAFSTVAKAGAAIGAGTAAAGAAIYGMATKSAAAADNIDKMSQKIGISRTTFQELDFITSQSGTSVNVLKGGIRTLTQQMINAQSGTKKSVDAFAKLGLSITDTNGQMKTQEEMMWEAFSALQGMEDQTEKAALATQLFGRAGNELMPMLNGASGSIESMRQQAHDLGLVIDDDAVNAGVKLTDTIDQTKRAFDAVMVKIGAQVMPLVQEALEFILDNMPTIQTVMSSVFDVISKLVSGAVTVFSGLFSFVTNNVIPVLSEKWTNVIQPAIETVFNAIKSAWDNVLYPAFLAIKDYVDETLAPALEDAWNNTIQPAITTVFDAISTAWDETLKPALEALWKLVTETILPKIQEAWPIIQQVVGDAFSAIKGFWDDTLKPAFDEIWNTLEEYLVPAFEKLRNYINDNVVPKIGALYNKLKELWDNVLSPVATFIVDTFVEAFKSYYKFIFETLIPKIGDLIAKLKELWDNVLSPIATFVKDTFVSAFQSLRDIWENTVIPKLSALHTKMTEFYNGVIIPIRNFIRDHFSPIFDALSTTLDNLKNGGLQRVADFLNGTFDTAVRSAKWVVNSLSSAIQTVISWVKTAISWFESLTTSATTAQSAATNANTTTGYITNPYQNVYGYAKGGTLRNGDVGIVGEAGAELLQMHGGGATITPLNGGSPLAPIGGRTQNNVFNIYQQPGESVEALAQRISEIISEDYNRGEAVFA